jgi:hypothetical protein
VCDDRDPHDEEAEMAVAVIQDWVEQETERSTAGYDAISEQLMAQEPIDGLHFHCGGFTGNGFRIFEVWESFPHYERFIAERLMPIVQGLDGDSTPPALTTYELHAFVSP